MSLVWSDKTGITLKSGTPTKNAKATKTINVELVLDNLNLISQLTIGFKAKESIYERESGIEILGNVKTRVQNKIIMMMKNAN